MPRILLMCFHIVVGQPIAAIPFDFNDNGIPIVNVSLPQISMNELFSFALKPKGSSWIMVETWGDDGPVEQTVPIILNFPHTNPEISFTEPELYLALPGHVSPDSESVSVASREIGIGPGSSLVEAFGSVNFLRNNQQLILNDTDASVFQANCAPDSVFRTSFVDFGIRADWVMTVDMGDWNPRPFRATTWMTNDREILHVPADNLEMVFEIIGPNWVDQRIMNCENVIRRLPRIVLSILESFGASEIVAGQLVLYPEDYTRMEPDGSCTLLIGTQVAMPNRARFNPLLVPNVNVRFTNSEIFVCDSID